MKPKFFVIGLILFSCSEQAKNDLQRENLKGRVKSKTEASYLAVEKFGEIQKGELQRGLISLRYDRQGNQVEESHYDKYGKLNYRAISKFDDNHRKSEENRYNSEGELLTRVIFKYDNNGNNIEQGSYKPDGSLVLRTVSRYNDNRKKIQSTEYFTDGRIALKRSYEYDESGNTTLEQITYPAMFPGTSDGLSVLTYKYDSNNNRIELAEKRDGIVTKIIYRYDSFDKKGNWLKVLAFWENGQPIGVTEREIEYY